MRWFLCVASVALIACSPCRVGTSRCDGRTLYVCTTDDDTNGPFEEKQACTAACVRVAATSFCALAEVPDPVCGDREGDRCVDDAIATCHLGYRTAEHACAGAHCIELAEVSFCALDAAPTSECADVRSTCLGGEWTECLGGYRTASVSCPGGETCEVGPVSLQNGEATVGVCALEPMPDPRCRTDIAGSTGKDAHCDGSVMTQCYGGHVVYRETCAAGVTCFRHDAGWGECLGDAVSKVGDVDGIPPHVTL